MVVTSLNFWAIFVASLSAFVIGGIWYGPLFGKRWQVANHLTDDDLAKSNPWVIYGGAFVLTTLAAFSLALFIGAKGDWAFGLFAGAMTGVFFVSTFLGVLSLFERRPLGLVLINTGYCSLTFSVMGLILGAWH